MLINFFRLKSTLITGLCCGTFCISTLVLQTPTVVGQGALDALQELDKPTDSDKPAVALTAQQQQQEARVKKIGDVLYNELDKLVPGDQAEGSDAAESLHAAVDAVLQRKPAMSLTIFEQAVKRDPKFPPAELLMAGLSFAAKDQKNGLRFLREAAVKNPKHPAVYAAYGRLASGAGRDVDAMVHFEKLKQLLTQDQTAPGKIALDETAITHYQNEYLEGMSQIAVQLKQYDLARDLIGQMLERNPENMNSLQLLAKVAFEEGKLDEAVTNLAKLREKQPKTPVPEAVIGSWFRRTGKPAKANEWFSKLPTAYPNNASAQLEYASWTLGQEDIEAAAKAVARAEAIESDTPAARIIKGKIAFYQRKYEDAVAIFKALYEINPQNPEIANMYVLSLIESSSAQNRAIANELASVNLQAYPNNRVVLAALGYVRLRTLGVNDQLKQIFSKVAKTRDGRSPEVDYFLASFLREAGDDKSAQAVLEQASQVPGLFLYRKQADQMKQALSAGLLPTN